MNSCAAFAGESIRGRATVSHGYAIEETGAQNRWRGRLARMYLPYDSHWACIRSGDVERARHLDVPEVCLLEYRPQLVGVAQRERHVKVRDVRPKLARRRFEHGLVDRMTIEVLPDADDGSSLRHQQPLDSRSAARGRGRTAALVGKGRGRRLDAADPGSKRRLPAI